MNSGTAHLQRFGGDLSTEGLLRGAPASEPQKLLRQGRFNVLHRQITAQAAERGWEGP